MYVSSDGIFSVFLFMIFFLYLLFFFFFFKQKTAYEMRISDWSSDVCSSDLIAADADAGRLAEAILRGLIDGFIGQRAGPRHDPDLARLVNVSRHDADLAFARRDHARTVRTDQHGVRILRAQRGLDLDHVVDREDRKSTRLNSSH